jgi:hypothetical protein
VSTVERLEKLRERYQTNANRYRANATLYVQADTKNRTYCEQMALRCQAKVEALSEAIEIVKGA